MFKWLKSKIKYDKDSYSIWGVYLHSHDGEEENNILIFYFGLYIISFILPFRLIKPIVDYHVFKKDINDNDMLDVMGTAYAINTYALSYYDGIIEFKWNAGDDMSTNITNHKGISKIIYLFWRYKTKVKTILLNLDSTSFSDITESSESNIEYMNTLQPRYYISIYREDNLVVPAECRAILNVYSYGGSILTKLIMSIFKKPIAVRRIEIEINRLEYKATLDMGDNETIIDAFKRFCILNRYVFIAVVEKG